ncbi:branched-chain amino acid ABC transporter permease [Bradyrhizobium sp. CCGB12]|uniref:branched-chain amino acid ABC transporter permease n=1 Tax=Bradyrhizobium sp. CCGB12 TaxID=2949632 RepID=UPI0020B427A5|nr:branched-chain amino acid ABC transporter permease [Bradyrhizobium sp. CCGB12]MCP3395316.1 branched-chain amino acid ABC transporter permease [Bradyrhizobium sp. CCGB12]
MTFERNFLLAAVALGALIPLVAFNEYALHIGIMIMFSVMLATSLNLIVGYVGEFPLGHTAFFGIGAYSAALLSVRLGLPIYTTIPLAAVVAAIAGLGIGAVTLRLRGPFFVIVTLCFAEVLRLVANNWIDLTNGPMGVSGIAKPASIAGATGVQQKLWFYYAGLLLAAISLLISYRFVYSNIGRAAVALRENRFVAQSIGIWPFYLGLVTFVLAAAVGGLAGGFYAHYISYVGPEVFGFSFMITMIIMVLAGGKGTLAGPVIGAVLVVFLEEFLRDFKDLRFSIFGLIVVGVVIFLPRGLMGFIGRRHESYERRPRGPAEGGAKRDRVAPALKPAGLNRGGAADA